MAEPDPTGLAAAMSTLLRALDQLRTPYVIGGSMASSAHGKWRSTNDVNIVSAMPEVMAERLSPMLGKDWYADPETIRNAIRAGRAFNIIHIPTTYKFDLFPATTDFHESQLQRGEVLSLTVEGAVVNCKVATAEDILLAKLRWYKDGGEVSERQWTDILDLIATNPALDLDYARPWAARLGVTGLFEKALAHRD